MALTVEPGLYIRPSPKIPQGILEHRGAHRGRRAGDPQGAPEVLTAALEKTPEAVERLVQAA